MNNHPRTPQRARQGSALITSTVVLVLLASMATFLTETTVSNLKMETRRAEGLHLVMASESAANIALDYLQRNPQLLKLDLNAADKKTTLPGMTDLEKGLKKTGITGDLPIAKVSGMEITASWCYMGQRAVKKVTVDGLPRLEVVAIGTLDSMTQDVYYIRGTATAGSAQDPNRWFTRRVEMLFVPYTTEVFVRSMFAHRGYDFMGAATTDSWDSANGSYATAPKGTKGDLGSEGDIYVQKPSNVQGQVDDFITYPLPPIDFPASTPYSVPDVLNMSCTLTDGIYRYKYVQLDDKDADVVTIDGNVLIYVDGPIDILVKKDTVFKYANANSRLTLIQNDYDPDAKNPNGTDMWPVKNTTLDMNGNDVVGNIDNPAQFLLMTAYSGELSMNGNGQFGGALFAPNATLKLNGTFTFYGAVIADAFASKTLVGDEQGKINGTFNFHYDEQLAKLKLPLPPRMGVVGWYTSNPRFGGP